MNHRQLRGITPERTRGVLLHRHEKGPLSMGPAIGRTSLDMPALGHMFCRGVKTVGCRTVSISSECSVETERDVLTPSPRTVRLGRSCSAGGSPPKSRSVSQRLLEVSPRRLDCGSSPMGPSPFHAVRKPVVQEHSELEHAA
jgi:hypothetical protein